MKKTALTGALFLLITSMLSCGNPASEPGNESQKVHDSLAFVGDTIVQHKNSFGTAIRQMMSDMNQLPVTGNPDRDFALLLKSHHQGGIDLAQAELNTGSDPGLKEIARQISQIQKPEIGILQSYLDSIRTGPAHSRPSNKDMKSGFNDIFKAHKDMAWDMSKMDTSMVSDKYFAAVMIQHLQSGIYLSEGFLKHGQDAKLLEMARQNIDRQRKQNEMIQAWTEKHP